ncbi:cupin domain-containing protein [Rhodanobacter sp. UC4451_H18]
MTKPVLNLADVVVQSAADTPIPAGLPQGATAERYDLRWGEVASRIGARQLGCNLTVVAPGKSACPFHSHRAEEEMFVILDGDGELRYGDTRYPVRAGDIIACPTGGPETAHQIINTGATEMRYLAISTVAPAEVCEYPDSGKFGAFADATAARFRHIGRTADARDYWEGE